MGIFLFFLALLSSAELTSQKSSSTETLSSEVNAEELARRLKNVHQCKEKIWPNNKIGEYSMYLVDYSSKPRDVSTVDPKTGKAGEASKDAKDSIQKGPDFPYNTRVPPKDNTGISISTKPNMGSRYFDTPLCPKEVAAYEKVNPLNPGTSDPYDLVMDVLTHESYHAADQSPGHACNKHNPTGWSTIDGGREMTGTDQQKSTVSYYRANIMHFLKAATTDRSNRQNNIAEALLWYRKLAQEFPNALKELSGADRREGTATYVGSMSTAIGKLGCDVSQDALKQAALEISHHRLRDVPMDLDRQSYGLGLLAGLLMDEHGYGDWKKEVMAGKTPLEVLNAKTKNVPQRQPKTVDAIVQNKKLFDAAQSCVKREVLKPIQNAYENKDTEYIAVSIPAPLTTNTTGDPISYQDLKWYPNVSFEGASSLKNWPSTQDQTKKCPQTGMRMIVLIPKSSVKADGSFEYSDGERTVKGNVGKASAHKDGLDSFDLYCAP